MVVVWTFLPFLDLPASESVESIERVTFKLALRRPSVLQMFENLHEGNALREEYKAKLQAICDQARAERLPSEIPLPRWVSVPPIQHISVLMQPLLFL